MEGESLLQQFHQSRQNNKNTASSSLLLGDDLENTLQVDIFLVDDAAAIGNNKCSGSSCSSNKNNAKAERRDTNDHIRGHLLALAELAVSLNDFVQQPQIKQRSSSTRNKSNSSNNESSKTTTTTTTTTTSSDDNYYYYPWYTGGDGPVFGVHVSDGIPHLRAVCHYGCQVSDCWMLVGLLMDFSSLSSSSSSSSSAAAASSCIHGWNKHDRYRLAIECWDLSDGQILLIEAAYHLPEWVDEDHDRPPHPPHEEIGSSNNDNREGMVEKCRHRCWILQGGMVHLIEPPEKTRTTKDSSSSYLSLHGALELIRTNSPLVTAPDPVNQCLKETVATVQLASHGWRHTAALAVPRSAALLLQRRPDLAAAACNAFAEAARTGWSLSSQSQQSGKNAKQQKQHLEPLAGTCEDWVWTTLAFGRTHYAMLKTITAAPHWKTPASIPAVYNTVEVKRCKRVGAVQATPHLRHGVQLGVRLVAGLDYLLQKQEREQQQQRSMGIPPEIQSLSEKRVLHYWTRIWRECADIQRYSSDCDTVDVDYDWLARSWQAGPNHAACSLEHILRCPCFREELIMVADADHAIVPILAPLSHPGESVAMQIRKEILRKQPEKDDDFLLPPRREDVDMDDSWMIMPSTAEEALHRGIGGDNIRAAAATSLSQDADKTMDNDTAKQTEAMDGMLNGVQTFLRGSAGMEGIANKSGNDGNGSTLPTNNLHKNSNKNNKSNAIDPVQIDPTVFLNILHTVLKADSAQDLLFPPAEDPFFSREDYELMEPADSDSEDDSGDENLTELMEAMDQELKVSADMSREVDRPDSIPPISGNSSKDDTCGDDMSENFHVLSNFLQSLEASEGAPGPVKNLLQEMGAETPDFMVAPEMQDSP